MTVNRTVYTDWFKRNDWNAPAYEVPSPNLLAIRDYLINRWGGVSLGIHGNRPVRGGETPSEHAYGAALDWRWAFHNSYAMNRFITREVLDSEVLPFLIDNSLELHIQGINDERRTWRSDRPGTEWDAKWRDYNTGYSGWVHIVTTDEGFNDSRPVESRLTQVIPVSELPPFDPLNQKWGLWPIAEKPMLSVSTPRFSGDVVRYLQSVIFFKAGGDIEIDGYYGPQTAKRVTDLQLWCNVKLQSPIELGVMTKETWNTVDYIAAM